ncbi:MAG: hypothetical protein CMH60_03820 [Myxococcales bacterium]|nr:hypothetical protein [Myxococcales bacterium]
MKLIQSIVHGRQQLPTLLLCLCLPLLVAAGAYWLDTDAGTEQPQIEAEKMYLKQALAAVDLLKKVAKSYGQRLGGAFPVRAANLQNLEQKSLIEIGENGAWHLAPGFEVTDLALTYAGGKNEMLITVKLSKPHLRSDFYQAISASAGFTSPRDCTHRLPASTQTRFCFSDIL